MKVVFLDRDGVINKDPEENLYVMKWNNFYFLPGAISAIKKLNKADFKIAVISNQAGVAKGLFTKKTLDLITARMLKKIKEKGGEIEKVFYCLHKSQNNCRCRKPKTGLLKKALNYFKVSSSQAFFVGDTDRDVIAGHKIGCRTILVLSGKTKLKDIKNWKVKPDYLARNLKEAVDLVILKKL